MNTHDIEPLKYGGPDSDDYVTGWNDCCARIAQDRKRRGEPVAWLYEDELPDNYPYDTMFPYSKVDGVRMFPVYAPQPAEQVIRNSRNTADPVKVLSKDEIRAVLLKHGYTIKPGHDDLKPYVYAAARELIALAQGRLP